MSETKDSINEKFAKVLTSQQDGDTKTSSDYHGSLSSIWHELIQHHGHRVAVPRHPLVITLERDMTK